MNAVAIDAGGYPLRMTVPDPRAFALHKAWLARRADRDPLKGRRDDVQARLVAHLVATRLRHLTFDDPALLALPAALRESAAPLLASAMPERASRGNGERIEPDW